MQQEPHFEPYLALGVPGAIYPKGYVVGVIDDLQAAERAIHALQSAGFAPEDIHLDCSDEMLRREHEHGARRTLGQRFRVAFQWGTDEGPDIRAYFQEAHRGNHILSIRARNSRHIDRIYEIMVSHHVRMIKHFGSWTITDLPS
jgi:hypothetical protein